MASERRLSEDARIIADAAVRAALPENLLPDVLSLENGTLRAPGARFELGRKGKVALAAVGKAAPYMAKSAMRILGPAVSGGLYLFLPGTDPGIAGLEAYPAAHPLPDERSVRAAQALMRLASGLGDDDLLLFLLSGGGSAQLCLPADGIRLEEKRELTERLLRSGADIHRMNTVRKHLSAVKGGRLAAAAAPASILSLIISDVIGNDPAVIASGPTHWDDSSFEEARDVLREAALWEEAPPSIRDFIEKGVRGEVAETMRPGDPVFHKVRNLVIGDNLGALRAARRSAENLGYRCLILTSRDRGEAREAAVRYAGLVAALKRPPRGSGSRLCLLAGGELTVTVRGRGRGGRNQEFVLAALPVMENAARRFRRWSVLSLGTDGIDGPTDAAGAWIDQNTAAAVRARSLDPSAYLAENDSYHFFEKTGGLIRTGPTHTNVMDIRIILLRD